MPSDSLEKLSIRKSHQLKPGHDRGRIKKLLWLLAIIIVLGTAGFLALGRPVSVETATVVQVYPTQSFTVLNASGYVVAQRKAAVASKITGRLEWLGVEEGSRVRRGQIIARLENRDLDAAVRQGQSAVQGARYTLEQAKAELEDATQAFRRQRELLQQGIVAQADFDVAEARYKRARAGVSGAESAVRTATASSDNARVNYDYSLIRAPFDAVVLTKNADVGDIITPLGAAANAKAAVFTIADMSSLEVEADVSESNLGQVRKGQPCIISLDALPNQRFRGEVHTIVPTADRSKASVMVKVRFLQNDSRILPEMSAKIGFLEHEARPEEQVPRTAVNPATIVGSSQHEGVYRLMGDQVRFTPVTRGMKLGDLVEVSGIKPGERVVLKPLDKIKDGSRVSLPEKK